MKTTKVKEIYQFIKKENKEYNTNDYEKLCSQRMITQPLYKRFLKTLDLGYVDRDSKIQVLNNRTWLTNGTRTLFDKDGNCILSNRWVIPIDDMEGNMIALVGWTRDVNFGYGTTRGKYVNFIDKEYCDLKIDFYNLKEAYEIAWSTYDGAVFLVEGVFDCIALRSLGLPVVSALGADLSLKSYLLKVFNRVVTLFDNDKVGYALTQKFKVKDLNNVCKVVIPKLEIIDNIFTKDIEDIIKFFDEKEVAKQLKKHLRSDIIGVVDL